MVKGLVDVVFEDLMAEKMHNNMVHGLLARRAIVLITCLETTHKRSNPSFIVLYQIVFIMLFPGQLM